MKSCDRVQQSIFCVRNVKGADDMILVAILYN